MIKWTTTLTSIAGGVAEDKEMTAGGLLAEHRLSKDAETVETGAQIGGTRSKPDPGGWARCQHDAPPADS